jgi:(S)-2-hydroxyglutarate dehydrogenase
MPNSTYDVAIIGAGIVGLSVGRELVRSHPHVRTLILEKEPSVAAHQTSHNSGVIHSGLYYKPGSLKARLCVDGANAMVDFCRDHSIPHEICGKIVVATDESELGALEELYRRGVANAVPGLRMLSAEQIREFEPHTVGIRGIHVPGTGITDYLLVARKYAELFQQAGGDLRTSAGVIGFRHEQSSTVIETTAGEFSCRYVVNCAGLQSDRIAKLARADLELKIVPFRGEYYEIVKGKWNLVHGLIYPVPDPRFPFLGVHFTKKIHGGVEAGPNAVLALQREGYTRSSFDLGDSVEIATFGGFWKMAAKYWKNGFDEFYRSWSKAAFTAALQKLLPELTADDIQPCGAGVRAQALEKSGKLVDDFRFVHTDRMLHVCNVPSPAATASLAIAREIVATCAKAFDLAADPQTAVR